MKKKIISIVLMIIVILGFTKITYGVDNEAKWYKYQGENGWYYYYTTENGNTDTVYCIKIENGNRTIAKLTFNENTWKYEYRGTDDLKYVINPVGKGTLESSGKEETSEYYFKLKAIMMKQSNNSVTMTREEYDNFTEQDKENREFAYDYWENQKKQQEQQQQQVNLKEINLDQIVKDAENFLDKGSQVDEDSTMTGEQIQDLSNLIYNVLFVIGIVVAVVIGGILGIQFITSGAEGKADIKQMLVPYIIGVVVLFGAFTIWKIVLVTLQGS